MPSVLFLGLLAKFEHTFLPEKFTQFPNAWLLKSGYIRTQISRKTNSFTTYRMAGNFSRQFDFADLGFFRFRGKKSRIWISDFIRGNNFSRISCTVFESNKNESRMVVFVTSFASILIEVQQSKKMSKFLLDSCWREFAFTGLNYRRSMKIFENRDN